MHDGGNGIAAAVEDWLAADDAKAARAAADFEAQRKADDVFALIDVATPFTSARFACRNVDCPNDVQWAHTRCDDCIEAEAER
jgi:hypothetical protein